MIPSTLHQTWQTQTLPPQLYRWQLSWKRHNPTWQLHFYDDQACLAFVEAACPEFQPLYQEFPYAIQRADFFRYLVLYHKGGLYADIDMECLRPLGNFGGRCQVILAVEAHLTRQRQQELGYRHPYQIANCIFAAAPGHWFLQRLIEAVAHQASRLPHTDNAIEESTGPRLLTRLYFALSEAEKQQITLLPQICWMAPTTYPNWWPLNRHMAARHHFLGSWKQPARPRALHRRWIERSKLPNPWPTLRGGTHA
ncbi:MAG: hypothetical protein KGS73_14525 [Chloroflexi bacterium]|nr:hypothetical protein [Chloroflexota bacterium]